LSEVLDAVGDTGRIVLSSALRAGAADILGVPKTIVALQERGVDAEQIEAMVFSNAVRLFGE